MTGTASDSITIPLMQALERDDSDSLTGKCISITCGASVATNAYLLIPLLCIGVMLQILGAPLTFWDLDGSCDLIELSLLSAVAIISAMPVLSPLLGTLYISEVSLTYRLSSEHLFFHPPLQIV